MNGLPNRPPHFGKGNKLFSVSGFRRLHQYQAGKRPKGTLGAVYVISPCLLLLRQQGQGPAQRNESTYLVTSTDSHPDLMLARTLLHFSPHRNDQEMERIKDGTRVPSQVFPPVSLHPARATHSWTYGLAPRVSCPLASLLARPGPTRGRCRFQQPLLFTWVTQRPPLVLQAAAALESACLVFRARYGEAPSTAPTSPCAWRRPSMRNGGVSF